MSLYHVVLASLTGKNIRNGINSAVVVANSASDAKQVLKAAMNLPSDGPWGEATVTEITEGADLEGWRARITIKDTSGDVVEQVTVTGAASADFDAIAALLVTALNATTTIDNAAYATPNLTIAGAADGIGDHTVEVALLPPTDWVDPTIELASLFGTITHEGSAGSALAVVMIDISMPEVKYEVTTR